MESDKERHARVWGSAPFERAAATIADMHDALVASLEPQPGERWLDLACGAGDVAFRAAEAGAVVTGSDLAPILIETAKRRAAEADLEVTLEVADCEALPYENESFDIVSSSIGVIFAPDHAAAWTQLRHQDPALARRTFVDSVRAYTDVASVRGVGLSLIGLAATEAVEGRPETAVQIAAAAEVYAHQEGIVNVYSDETPGREFVDQARASLSADVVASATEVGSKLTIGEALDLARLPQTTAT